MRVDAPAVDRDLLDLAIDVADRAGVLSAELFFRGTSSSVKPDGTEVTDADLAVEDAIRAQLRRHVPDDAVYGEEAGGNAGTSGRRWITDPISGTAYFTRRMPLFANLLACEDEHGPAIGVINMPVQQEMVFAGRGRGCWLRAGDNPPCPALVTGHTAMDGALILAVNQHTWSEELLMALHRRVLLVGGIHHAILYVATGRVDAAVLTHQSEEDHAPLPVILAEAGGLVTDLDGGPVRTGDGTALASNGLLHDDLLAAVAGLPRTGRPKALDRQAGR